MAAIVLGGSYAGGTQHGVSDLDIGLYYREDNPFDIGDRLHSHSGARRNAAGGIGNDESSR
jgi:predicted nucleotidyltransferase